MQMFENVLFNACASFEIERIVRDRLETYKGFLNGQDITVPDKYVITIPEQLREGFLTVTVHTSGSSLSYRTEKASPPGYGWTGEDDYPTHERVAHSTSYLKSYNFFLPKKWFEIKDFHAFIKAEREAKDTAEALEAKNKQIKKLQDELRKLTETP